MPAPRGVFALLSCLLITVAAGSAGTPAGLGTPSVAWPPSGGLLLAEVMTGGASASDEYVEIANAGSAAADLGGCELVYVTASGSTITRKAAFTAPLLLVPGQHLLVANSAGIYGPLADATYTGGLAADGGAVVLRKTDGTVIDAVGWGTAVNSYVEGAVAPAPPARSSIERRPGGSGGNLVDTNDNGSDFLIQPNPVPQSLASRPVPGASDAPSASPSDTPTASTPTELASPIAPLPSPSATPSGSATPAASLASSPTSTQTEAPAPTGATETETPTAQPTGPAETETPTATPTDTAGSTATATDTGAPTAAPTATATPTPTPSPRSSAAPSSPATPGPTPRLSPTPAPT
ncbi:MAG TPA: lamin tail domain-containing protein, partial [Candidatus Limnocylindrales bacterium]